MKKKTIARKHITALAGKMSRWKSPYFLIESFIKLYIRYYKIQLNDYDFSFEKGISFHDFFTRKLKPGSRSITGNFISPVDGTITALGIADSCSKIPAKSQQFTFEELTGCVIEDVFPISYAVIYLSPADYHRIHAPFALQVSTITHIEGCHYPVHLKSQMKRDSLFCQNERVVLSGTCEYGRYWFVLIGAMIVGSVYLSFTGTLHSKDAASLWGCNYQLNTGDEIGYFALGSTVVLFVEGNRLKHNSSLPKPVKLGDAME